MNILIIKHSSLGDALHSTGHIRTIRETYPDSTITLLTAPPSHELFTYNNHIDHILVFEKERAKREWKSNAWWVIRHIFSLLKDIRKIHYDLAFDLQGRLKSVFFLYAAKADKKYVKGRWLFLKRFRKPEIHAIKEMDHVLQLAGIQVRNSDMEIPISTHEERFIEALLKRVNPLNKKIIIMSPFTRWETKNWAIEKYQQVINSLDMDVLIILTGLGDKREEIAKLATPHNSRSVVNLAGDLTLLELAALMKKSDLLVTGDSFPMHLASAMHTPLIALFGPTDEERIGPVGKHCSILRASDICRRCYQRDHCAQDCINDIQPKQVLEEIHRWLRTPQEPNNRSPITRGVK